MPIVVRCACGKEYHFKDEYAGRRAKCPACGQVVRIPGARPAGRPSPHSPLREDRRSRTMELAILGSAGFVVLVGIGLVVYFLFFSGSAPRAARPAAPSPATQQPSAAASQEPVPVSGPPAPAPAGKSPAGPKSPEAKPVAPVTTGAKPPDAAAPPPPPAVVPASASAPPLPPGLTWPKELEDKVKAAVAICSKDPVTSCLTLQEMLNPTMEDLQKQAAGKPDDKEDIAREAARQLALVVWPRTIALLEGDLGLSLAPATDEERFLLASLTEKAAKHMALEMIAQGQQPLIPGQCEWLKKAVEAARPAALAVLDQDFKSAVAARDLREAVITAAVAEKVQKDGLAGARAAVAALKKDILAGTLPAQPVWKVTQAKGQRLEHGYLGVVAGLTAPEGHFVLRVQVRVENISTQPDPGYAPWVLNDLKRGITEGQAKAGGTEPAGAKPRRLLADDFILLALPEGRLLPCAMVSEECALRGLVGQPGPLSPETAIPGAHIEQGAGMDLDVLFVVPAATTKLRLLVLGAAPVSIELTTEQ